jgi:hypothetical protein
MTSTQYRVNHQGHYITALDDRGCPVRWVEKAAAGRWPRAEAEALAQRLADYLAGLGQHTQPHLVRVCPASGGITHWRPKGQPQPAS